MMDDGETGEGRILFSAAGCILYMNTRSMEHGEWRMASMGIMVDGSPYPSQAGAGCTMHEKKHGIYRYYRQLWISQVLISRSLDLHSSFALRGEISEQSITYTGAVDCPSPLLVDILNPPSMHIWDCCTAWTMALTDPL